jgi:hypothetical protein
LKRQRQGGVALVKIPDELLVEARGLLLNRRIRPLNIPEEKWQSNPAVRALALRLLLKQSPIELRKWSTPRIADAREMLGHWEGEDKHQRVAAVLAFRLTAQISLLLTTLAVGTKVTITPQWLVPLPTILWKNINADMSEEDMARALRGLMNEMTHMRVHLWYVNWKPTKRLRWFEEVRPGIPTVGPILQNFVDTAKALVSVLVGNPADRSELTRRLSKESGVPERLFTYLT